jgi:photosystem II stability/assembly factor-like uncharacterized protein
MNVQTRAGVAVALALVSISACSSGGSNATSTTTTVAAPQRATTSTTTRRRTETTGTTTVAAPTTTTATQVSAPSARAVSASFVSPNHGFALTSDGHIDETTDAGHGWHRVGSLPLHGDPPRIRYIDAADGFAFGPDAGTPQFLVTHDGGATWTAVPNAPFTYVGDVEIARGMIYALAETRGDNNFRLWETRVEHLAWKQVPPTQPIGAGPVPIEQIVLNGGKGWILNEDRTVISGARLTASTTWAKWTPPCVHGFGPAYLSASTATDLAASCDEGEWGGHYSHVTPTVWFSHDGGRSFLRKPSPAFGPVLSPNPRTAVVAGNQSLQRTTDTGATWTTVGSLPTGDTTDWGFTTSTQGFVIRQGEMLMTYDAGATWRQVPLP